MDKVKIFNVKSLMATKLKQSRNGYASQISSTIKRLNTLCSEPDFDAEYADHLSNRLNSYIASIHSLTEELCHVDVDNRQQHIDYATNHQLNIVQIQKSIQLRIAGRHKTNYAESQASVSIVSDVSHQSLVEKKIVTKEARKSLLKAQHELEKAELEEEIEKEMYDLMIDNQRLIDKVNNEIRQHPPRFRHPSKQGSKLPLSQSLKSDCALSTHESCIVTDEGYHRTFELPVQHSSVNQAPFPTKTRTKSIMDKKKMYRDHSIKSDLPEDDEMFQMSEPSATQRKPVQEAIDDFIDELVEGEETVLKITDKSPNTSSLEIIRHEFESRTLPTIELTKFDGDPSKWPEFINNFKSRVHLKYTFTDEIRMERLLSTLEGDAKSAVESIGVNGLFYAIALKTLKRDFGNPALVSHLKLNRLLDEPQIKRNDRIALRKYQQQLKSTVTWLQSINFTSYLSSTEVITKAVMRLPNDLRQSYLKSSMHNKFEGDLSLVDFERWFSNRMLQYFNPIATLIATKESQSKNRLPTNPKKVNTQHMSNVSRSHVPSPIKCWLCHNNHRLQECEQFLSKSPTERKETIIELKLCWNCLSKTHFTRDCSSKNHCREGSCTRRHHTVLHGCYQNPSSIGSPTEQVRKTFSNKLLTSSASTDSCSNTFLQVIPVFISNGHTTVATNTLLDCGSDATLVRKDVADSLSLNGTKKSVQFTNVITTSKEIHTRQVNFAISSRSHPQQISISKAWVVDDLKITTPPVNINQLKEKHHHLQNIYIEYPKSTDISILIGADMPELLLHKEFRKGRSDEPMAVKTQLGWVLFGGTNTTSMISSNFINHQPESLHQSVERFWAVESYGTLKHNDATMMSSPEKLAMKILEETTTKIDGQYHIGMLWKQDTPVLPNNRVLAVKRLHSVERKLGKAPELEKRYHTAMNDYINQGHARKLSKDQRHSYTARTNYVPHHCVVNPNKPDKVRVVFDAAAKFSNTSLNSNLLTGPDLLNNLVSVLLQFRVGKVAIMADIEQMFNQVKVYQHDQDALRFLWRNRPSDPIDEYVMTVHLFGKCDSPTIANYALKRSARDTSEVYSTRVTDAVENQFYMDDYLGSYDDEKTAIDTADKLMRCLSLSHFRLTKWISNSTTVMKSLPSSELSKSIVSLDLSLLPTERTLGILWDLNTDSIKVKSVDKWYPDTKRGLLSLISSIFDPLGIVTPSILEPKLIIQELWHRKLDWDISLPHDLMSRWNTWKTSLHALPNIAIDRCYGYSSNEHPELHVFADASEKAYGCVSYLKSPSTNNVSFVLAKSRLAPLKGAFTTPKLELQAAVTAVRQKDAILQRIFVPENQIYFWTDSKTVLRYIKNDQRRFPAFVMHRVNEIRVNSIPNSWNFIPGKENPADHCTRYASFKILKENTVWLNGPDFLREANFDYTSFGNTKLNDIQEDPINEVSLNKVASKTKDNMTPSNTIKWERFSSLHKLIRTIAWIVKFLYDWKLGKSERKTCVSTSQLSPRDLNQALVKVCKISQSESLDLNDTNLLPLKPVVLEGLIRIGGRLKNSHLSSNQKHQIILAQHHPLSTLVARHHHEENLHTGREHTLSIIREKFWIIKGKSVVRKVIKDCLFCERRRVTPTTPVMSDLPRERLATNEPPFTYTGVDYFGPLIVKLTKQTRSNQRTSKRYGVLFTCLTFRAIHIELANDLSTDSFLLALRRFRSRRGNPKLMWTDNGTNFVGASGELKEAIKARSNIHFTRAIWHFVEVQSTIQSLDGWSLGSPCETRQEVTESDNT